MCHRSYYRATNSQDVHIVNAEPLATKLTKAQVSKRKNKPPIQMGQRQSLKELVFEAFGSSFNHKDFVSFEKELNMFKEMLWSGSVPMPLLDSKNLLNEAEAGALPSTYFLSVLRSVLSVYKYLEHPTVSSRMKKDKAHVTTESSNAKELVGKDVTSTTGQVLDLPALWVEFMTKQLTPVETHGKTWLNARLKEAETAYEAHMKFLKKHKVQLDTNENQVGAVKQNYDTDRKIKTKNLELELKQKDKAVADAKKSEDAAKW
ncbi:hypothetical protein E8E13_009093 [Curvularia kusanoi]|uniref:Uncharacterized protein n=1 Tax=Curvularia kusanoi TaxID=90978 RepID=A0A9P4TF50_CURKU|nr:hypothetical protein E8E13_009093 [Curvularia kusanoi]